MACGWHPVMVKSCAYWRSITLSIKDIYQQDVLLRSREYRM